MSECSAETANFTQGRLTQINNYKTQSYRFLAAAMDRYSLVLGILIVLLILRNAQIMPDNIFAFLFAPVLAYLIIDLLYTFYSFKSRGTFNFDTISWSFNKKSAPSPNANGGLSGGYGISNGIRCSNADCCVDGMTWDSGVGKCTII